MLEVNESRSKDKRIHINFGTFVQKKTNLGTPVCTIIDEFLENF